MPVPSGQYARISGISWAQNKAVFAVSVVVGKGSALLLFDEDQATFKPLAGFKNQEMSAPALSPDGSELVVAVSSAECRVARRDVEDEPGEWQCAADCQRQL